MAADVPAERYEQRQLRLPVRLLSDERLAEEVTATGSDRAFTLLFERHHRALYRYCRSLTGNEQDAQDALQTALTKALVALRQGRRTAPVRPWLFRIAHNESISIIRSRSPAAELPAELESSLTLVETFEQRQRLGALLADLQELPERQRAALVLRELSGLSHEEIAQALEVGTGAAKQTILEARRSLMEFAEGRAMPCEDIQRIISDGDRRSLRGRRVRAHLRGCASCAAFAQAITRRQSDMLALWPALPASGAAGLLAKITGAGSGHGGGGAGLAAGTAAKGVGTAISVKAAVATGAAVIATATVGAVAVVHRSSAARPAGDSHASARTSASAAVHRSPAAAPRPRAAGSDSRAAGGHRVAQPTERSDTRHGRPAGTGTTAISRTTPAAGHGVGRGSATSPQGAGSTGVSRGHSPATSAANAHAGGALSHGNRAHPTGARHAGRSGSPARSPVRKPVHRKAVQKALGKPAGQKAKPSKTEPVVPAQTTPVATTPAAGASGTTTPSGGPVSAPSTAHGGQGNGASVPGQGNKLAAGNGSGTS